MKKETEPRATPVRPSPKRRPRSAPRSGSGGGLVTWILLAAVLGGQLVLLFRTPEAPPSSSPESSARLREYANALVDAQLYDAAAAEYQRLLHAPGLDATERANLTFLLANLYKDDAHDYQKALQ